MNFTKRFPTIAQLAPVYGVVVAILYSWSLLRFFWRLPSFLNYSTTGEIGVIFAYETVVNFLESLLVIAVPIFLSVVLPQKWFHDHFVVKGVLLVSMSLGYLAYIYTRLAPDAPFPYTLFNWSPVVLLSIMVLVFSLGRINFVAKILEDVADRFVIFLYISIPVSAVCLIVVLFRNIL